MRPFHQAVIKSLTPVLILVLLLSAACIEEGPVTRRAREIEDIQAATEQLRGLPLLNKVNTRFLTREGYRQLLREEEEKLRSDEFYNEEVEREWISTEQEVYALLGLAEKDRTRQDMERELDAEYVIGFYLLGTGTAVYVVTDEPEMGDGERLTLVHEYTHALQDQHFDMWPVWCDRYYTDEILAFDALMEGDATVMEERYAREELGVDFGDDTAPPEEIPWEPMTPETFVEELIYFPYEKGRDFILACEEHGDVNTAYRNPPVSTEQILHPEKYLVECDEPRDVYLPDMNPYLGTEWDMEYSDLLGEFALGLYLQTYLTPEVAEPAVAGWDGDWMEYWRNDEGGQCLILYSVWDSPGESLEFYRAYLSLMDRRTGGTWPIAWRPGVTWWQDYYQNVYLEVHTDKVLLILANGEETVAKARSAFPPPELGW